MKTVCTLLFASLLLSGSLSCTQLGYRIAYGRGGLPKTPTEAVQEAIQIKKEVDQAAKTAKQDKRNETEDKYAALQEEESVQAKYLEMRSNYLQLRGDLDALKARNADLNSQNLQLAHTVAVNEGDIESLQRMVKLLSDAVSSLTSRLNTLETTPAARTVAPKPINIRTSLVRPVKTAEAVETVNLGSMAVIGGSSIRRTKSGAVSIRSGSTHATYRPRSAPVRQPQQVYHLGPRGGCYYYTGSGNKEYVDRSLCR